jgi:hypothetical protein
LRDEAELNALDGVFNAVKSPLRLHVERDFSLDQRCESLSDMISGLHRVFDLLSTLFRHLKKRIAFDTETVDLAIETLGRDPAFLYLNHFTNAIKHIRYIKRGEKHGMLYIDEFSYKDRGVVVHEDRRTSEDIIGYAQNVICLTSKVMTSISKAVANVEAFDPAFSAVCATPSPEVDFDPSDEDPY